MSRYGRDLLGPSVSIVAFGVWVSLPVGLGLSQRMVALRIRLQLCKPVTWPPLIFGVIAGGLVSMLRGSPADMAALSALKFAKREAHLRRRRMRQWQF